MMFDIRGRAGEFLLYFFDFVLSAGFMFLLAIVAARSLSVQEFGLFSLLASSVAMLLPVVHLGLRPYIFSEAASNGGYPRSAVAMGVVAGCAISILLAMFAQAIIFVPSLGVVPRDLAAIASLRLLGGVVLLVVSGLQGCGAQWEYIPAKAAVSVLMLVLMAVAYRYVPTVQVFVALFSLESLLLFLVLGRNRFSFVGRPKLQLAKISSLVFSSFPFLVQSVLIVFYVKFDHLYVGFFFGERSLGMYAAAAKLAEVVSLFFTICGMIAARSLLPRLADSRDGAHVALVSVIPILTTISAVLLCVIGFYEGGRVLGFVFGGGYAGANTIFYIYIISAPVVGLGVLYTRIIFKLGGFRFLIFSGIAGVAIEVALCILLSPHLGELGVSLSSVCGYVGAVAVLWFGVKEGLRSI